MRHNTTVSQRMTKNNLGFRSCCITLLSYCWQWKRVGGEHLDPVWPYSVLYFSIWNKLPSGTPLAAFSLQICFVHIMCFNIKTSYQHFQTFRFHIKIWMSSTSWKLGRPGHIRPTFLHGSKWLELSSNSQKAAHACTLVGHHQGHSKYMLMWFWGPLLKKGKWSQNVNKGHKQTHVSLGIYDESGLLYQ